MSKTVHILRVVAILVIIVAIAVLGIVSLQYEYVRTVVGSMFNIVLNYVFLPVLIAIITWAATEIFDFSRVTEILVTIGLVVLQVIIGYVEAAWLESMTHQPIYGNDLTGPAGQVVGWLTLGFSTMAFLVILIVTIALVGIMIGSLIKWLWKATEGR